MSVDEQLGEEIFYDFHIRTAAGNYLVELPYRQNAARGLGSAYQVAPKRVVTKNAFHLGNNQQLPLY